MTYRNDLDAAHARIEALEREKRTLAEHNERMNARLGTPQSTRVATRARARRLDPSSASYEPSPWPFVVVIGLTIVYVFVIIATAHY